MKQDKHNPTQNGKPQTGKDIKKDMPVKNPMTDPKKRSASETPGLNQDRTTRDDLFPSDGDNLTNV